MKHLEVLEVMHEILIAGSGFASCRQQLLRFFDRSMLLRYDEVVILENDSINGGAEGFRSRITQGLAANHRVLGEFIANLQEEGFISLDDLHGLEKGYLSKLLHIIAHLVDGFIGIDSRFYNLVEDSHGVSRNLFRQIEAAPEHYWILQVKGRIASPAEDPLDALRTFEGRTKYTT
jgi:hypothetical protein